MNKILPKIKNTPRKSSRQAYPYALEREYTRLLESMAQSIIDALERDMTQVLPLLRMDSLDDLPENTGILATLKKWLLGAAASVKVDETIALMKIWAGKVQNFHSKQWQGVLRKAYGVDIFTTEKGLQTALNQFEAENIALIKSIPNKYLDTLHGKIIAAVRAGKSTADLTQIIRETYPLPLNRARLIARDQTGKLNGQLSKIRQTNIGVKQYVWRGMLDSRERDHHIEREGQTFDWDNPPFDGHPGEPIQCRCFAEPLLPLLSDLENAYPMPSAYDAKVSHGLSAQREQAGLAKTLNPFDPKKAFDLIDDVMADEEIIKSKLKEWGMNKGEMRSIMAYTRSAYKELNFSLRERVMDDNILGFEQVLHRALDKIPNFEQRALFRYAGIERDFALNRYQIDAIVQEDAFVSTSLDPNLNTFYGNTRFVIVGKTGKYIADVSRHKNEKEVLFKSKSKFKVLKRHTDKNGVLNIYMEQV